MIPLKLIINRIKNQFRLVKILRIIRIASLINKILIVKIFKLHNKMILLKNRAKMMMISIIIKIILNKFNKNLIIFLI